jgi:hypothetical protein
MACAAATLAEACAVTSTVHDVGPPAWMHSDGFRQGTCDHEVAPDDIESSQGPHPRPVSCVVQHQGVCISELPTFPY